MVGIPSTKQLWLRKSQQSNRQISLDLHDGVEKDGGGEQEKEEEELEGEEEEEKEGRKKEMGGEAKKKHPSLWS